MDKYNRAAGRGRSRLIPNGFKVSEEQFSLHQIDLQSTTSQLSSNLHLRRTPCERSLDGYCIGTSANSYGLVGHSGGGGKTLMRK